MAAVRAVRDLDERMLCAGGPLPALCEEQRTLARIVAEALDAPPGDEALVTLTQAATGTGKTVALLAPILALAGLQKRQGVRSHRATLSTYTNQLTRQILEDDAPRVSRALESLGYPAVSVATRAGRRQFIDPDRVERSLARLDDRRDGPDGRSLESLGAFSTFAEAEDHGVYLPPDFTADALCLTPKSSPPAAAAFAACKRAAAEADVVLTNHALVLTDCRLRGRLLGPVVETVVFDEADALPEAARSVADDRIDLALVRDIVDAVGADAREPFEALARLCAEETRRGKHRLLALCSSRRAILELVGRICEALEDGARTDDEAAEEAGLLRARLRYFEACAQSEAAIAAIAAGPAPALAVVHREPVRLVRGLLNRTRAAFFVSATLAAPAVRPSPNDFLRALGIAPGMRAPARLNFAGWAELEPRRYGRMGFRFADRAVPGPFERDRDPPVSHPAHLDYVARAIEEARKSGRVLVLCTSYALVDELAKRVSSPVVHVRGARLGSCLDAFRADRRAVLLTPAAWSGVSLPGLVDHVVIPRVPFRPHAVRDAATRSFLAQLGLSPVAAQRLVASDRNAAVRRKLAQGIGRGIRGPRESCTVWLLDPRFPLPKSMARAIGGPGQGRAAKHLQLINCIPARFRNGRRPAIDQGRVWPVVPPARSSSVDAPEPLPGRGLASL